MMSAGIGSDLVGAAANQNNGDFDIADFLMESESPGSYSAAAAALVHVGEKHVGDVAEPADRSAKKARVWPRAGQATAARGSGVGQEQGAAGRPGDERQMQGSSLPGEGDAIVIRDVLLSPDDLRKVRYLQRLEANRLSGIGSRVRTKEYVRDLEDKLAGVKDERHRLKGQVDNMRSENMQLQMQMMNLQAQLQKPE